MNNKKQNLDYLNHTFTIDIFFKFCFIIKYCTGGPRGVVEEFANLPNLGYNCQW
jgi:hypothetical protein